MFPQDFSRDPATRTTRLKITESHRVARLPDIDSLVNERTEGQISLENEVPVIREAGDDLSTNIGVRFRRCCCCQASPITTKRNPIIKWPAPVAAAESRSPPMLVESPRDDREAAYQRAVRVYSASASLSGCQPIPPRRPCSACLRRRSPQRQRQKQHRGVTTSQEQHQPSCWPLDDVRTQVDQAGDDKGLLDRQRKPSRPLNTGRTRRTCFTPPSSARWRPWNEGAYLSEADKEKMRDGRQVRTRDEGHAHRHIHRLPLERSRTDLVRGGKRPQSAHRRRQHAMKESPASKRARLLELQRLLNDMKELQWQLAEVKQLILVASEGNVRWDTLMAGILGTRSASPLRSGMSMQRQKMENKRSSTTPPMNFAREATTGKEASVSPRESAKRKQDVAKRLGCSGCQAERACSTTKKSEIVKRKRRINQPVPNPEKQRSKGGRFRKHRVVKLKHKTPPTQRTRCEACFKAPGTNAISSVHPYSRTEPQVLSSPINCQWCITDVIRYLASTWCLDKPLEGFCQGRPCCNHRKDDCDQYPGENEHSVFETDEKSPSARRRSENRNGAAGNGEERGSAANVTKRGSSLFDIHLSSDDGTSDLTWPLRSYKRNKAEDITTAKLSQRVQNSNEPFPTMTSERGGSQDLEGCASDEMVVSEGSSLYRSLSSTSQDSEAISLETEHPLSFSHRQNESTTNLAIHDSAEGIIAPSEGKEEEFDPLRLSDAQKVRPSDDEHDEAARPEVRDNDFTGKGLDRRQSLREGMTHVGARKVSLDKPFLEEGPLVVGVRPSSREDIPPRQERSVSDHETDIVKGLVEEPPLSKAEGHQQSTVRCSDDEASLHSKHPADLTTGGGDGGARDLHKGDVGFLSMESSPSPGLLNGSSVVDNPKEESAQYRKASSEDIVPASTKTPRPLPIDTSGYARSSEDTVLRYEDSFRDSHINGKQQSHSVDIDRTSTRLDFENNTTVEGERDSDHVEEHLYADGHGGSLDKSALYHGREHPGGVDDEVKYDDSFDEKPGKIGDDIVTSSGRGENARRVSLRNDELDNQGPLKKNSTRMLSEDSSENIKEANGGTADSIPNRQSEIDNQRSSDAIPLGTACRTTSADKGEGESSQQGNQDDSERSKGIEGGVTGVKGTLNAESSGQNDTTLRVDFEEAGQSEAGGGSLISGPTKVSEEKSGEEVEEPLDKYLFDLGSIGGRSNDNGVTHDGDSFGNSSYGTSSFGGGSNSGFDEHSLGGLVLS